MSEIDRKKEQRMEKTSSLQVASPPLRHNQAFPWTRSRPALLSVLLLALLANYNVLANGFGWDDENIIKNLSLPDHWWNLLLPNPMADSPSKTNLPYFRPVVLVSYLIDKALWGNNPFGFHLSVWLAHLLNTALVFFLAQDLAFHNFQRLKQMRRSTSTHNPHFSTPDVLPFLVASLFAVHPIHAEAVAWIAGRNDVFCTTFLLASMLLYLQFHRTRHWILFWFSMLAFLFALLTKETAVGLALLFPLYTYLSEPNRVLPHLRSLRVVALLIPSAILIIYFYLRMIHLALPWANASSTDWFSLDVALKVIRAYGYYLMSMVFPYPHSPFITALPASPLYLILSGVASTTLLCGILFTLVYRDVVLGIGLAWTLFFLAPPALIAVLNLAATPVAERYAYLPSLGLMMAALWLILKALMRLSTVMGWPARRIWTAGGLLWILIIPVWGCESWSRNALWRSPSTFWESVVTVLPGNTSQESGAHNNLGMVYEAQRRFEEAVREYQFALKLKPDYVGVYYNLGNVYKNMGRWEEAVQAYQTALTLKQDYAEAHNNLGEVYRETGRAQEAAHEFQTALRLNPAHAAPHTNLGLVYINQGAIEDAIREYQSALRLEPDNAQAHYNLGLAYAVHGEFEEAIRESESAILIKPDFGIAYNNLGAIYARQGKFEFAIEKYQAALRSDPNNIEAHYNLGLAYGWTGRLEEARRHYQETIRIKPDFEPALKALSSLSHE